MKKTYSFNFKSTVILLLYCLVSLGAYAQDKAIQGEVKDIGGEALPGVTIVFKGTTIGTVSDMNGAFKLNVPANAEILVFSFIGMKKQEVNIGGRNKITVTMEEDSYGLDEVIAVGYGTMKKSDLTGSVASVSSKDLTKTVNRSIVDALDGRASGVKVSSGEGAPGGAMSIRIRGGTSLSASNEPLYVIDGFPIIVEQESGGAELHASTSSNPLAGIDPKDIESMQILKDASATAIYGSRGANGVIIITTKTGKIGKSSISFEASGSMKSLSKKLDVFDEVQYAQYRKDQNAHDPTSDIYIRFEDPESFAGTGTDWQDEVYQTAYLQNYRLSISGGTKGIRYNGAFGAFLDEGIIKSSSFDRYNGRLNVNAIISDKLRFAGNMTGSYSLQGGAPTGGANGERAGAVSQALFYPPVESADDDEPISDLTGVTTFSPLAVINNSDIENKSDLFMSNISLDYDILDNLTFKTLLGATISNRKNAAYYTTETGRGAMTGGYAELSHFSNRSWVFENTLTYKKNINKHNFNVLGGFTAQAANIERFKTVNTAFDIEDLGFNNIGIGTNPQIPSSNSEDWSLASGLGRINYDFDQRYLLTFSLRADGSSRFAEGKKWGYFPAAAFAWRLTNESFLKDSKLISNLKFRAGYGVTGNQEVPRYQSLSSMGINFYSFGLGNGSVNVGTHVDKVSNPELTWETTKQANLGLDFGFFKNRLAGSVDVYSKKTSDMLLAINLIPTSGIAAPALQNIGSMNNTGLEISLNSVNIQTSNFTWTTNFNISFNKNEIKDLGPYDQIFVDVPGGWHQVVNEVILKPGESIGTFYGYETDGIYGLSDNPTPEEEALAGSRIIVDQITVDTDGDGMPDEADGVINADDRVVLGSAMPKHYGGITNDFQYKGFDLSMFWNWSYGNKVYNANRVYLEEFTSDGRNHSTVVSDYWTPDNQDSDIAALWKGETSIFMDRHVEDGSFLRLKNVSLGYTFSDRTLSKTPLSFAKIYIAGQNLWTLTNYKGYNPESNISRNPVTPGIDWGAYPLSRIYTIGLNVRF